VTRESTIVEKEGIEMNERTKSAAALHVYKWMGWIFAAGIVVQVFLAGLALFHDPDTWAAHASLPRFFAFLPLLMLILAIAARLPAEFRGKSLRMFIMVILMFLTAIVTPKISGILAALHPIIALEMFRIAVLTAHKASAQAKIRQAEISSAA
jgi:hypothetical protein